MLMLYIFFIKNVNKNIVLFLLVFVQYLRIFIHFKEIIANFVGVKDGAELRIMSYELRITNLNGTQTHQGLSRPASTDSEINLEWVG